MEVSVCTLSGYRPFWSTLFVTKGDTNDAQLELTLASQCLCNSTQMFSVQMSLEASMRTDSSLNYLRIIRIQKFLAFCVTVKTTSPSFFKGFFLA